MSAISSGRARRRREEAERPRREDPRVVRTRAAVLEAARRLFLEYGLGGTTMAEIADVAGVTKRTLYNNYSDKSALFTEIVTEVIGTAERFSAGLRVEFDAGKAGPDPTAALHAVGRRMALAILRPEIISLRRLLIAEARTFPDLAKEYYARAPGKVIATLAIWMEQLSMAGSLRAGDARRAAEQFAYLVVGASLDRAVLAGTVPTREEIIESARDGVVTFLARYRAGESAGK